MDIAKFYDDRTIYPESHKASHWSSEHFQQENFNFAYQIGPLERTDNILDLGCGYGDLHKFFKDRNFQGHYEGIDVSPKVIAIARKRHLAKFTCIDFLDDKFQNTYDWIFALGPFNLVVENQDEYLRQNLQKMYRLARKGFYVFFTSDYCPKGETYLYYYDPVKVMQECLKITHTFNINQVVAKNGFLLYMYNKEWLDTPLKT
jgi:SAM-dependent methyltransferase